MVARQVYTKAYEFLRKYDQNHLIFSDRYVIDEMPDYIVKEALPYIDAIAVQPPARVFDRSFYDGLYAKYDKPIYIADHVTSYATKDHPKTMGQVAKDPDTYVKIYQRYLYEAFATPYIIGLNKCQYQEQFRRGLLKQGLIDEDGNPYPTIDGIRRANLSTLEMVYGVCCNR